MVEGVITALEIQKHNKERVNVYLDGEFAFALNLMQAADLHKGQSLSAEEIESLRDDDAIVKAVERAVNFLSYRPRSTHEVRQNLAKKDLPDEVIEEAIARLNRLGYLDDRAFARLWVEDRNRFKPSGAQALRYQLRRKGVSDSILDAVMDDLVDEENAAYDAAQKRLRRLKGHTRQDFRRKLAGFLQRRGFTYDAIRSVIDRLTDELDAGEPGYFADDAGQFDG